MASGRKVVIEFLGEDKSLGRTMDGIDGKSGKLSGTLKKVGKAALLGFAAAGAGAVIVGKKLIDAGEAAGTSNARIEQISDSMGLFGNESDKVARRIQKMSEAQARATGVDTNAVKLTNAKLLTFKELAKTADDAGGAFDRASDAALDMAAAGFGTAEGNAVQLGKALNDPVKGITALNKSGVTFTEQEKARIATLVESNKVGEAQGLILKAIETQVGGTAEATANGTDKMRVMFGQLTEQIGMKLVPVVDKMATWFADVGMPALQTFGAYLGEHFPPIWERIQAVVSTVMGALQGDVGGGLGRVQQIFTDVTAIVMSLWDTFGATIIDYARTSFENVKQIVDGALTVVQGIFQTFSALLQGDWSGAWDGIKKILSGAWEIIKGIVKQALNVVGTLFKIGWTVVTGIVSTAWDGIKTAVSNGIDRVVEWVRGIPGRFSNALSSLKSTAADLFRDAMDAGKEKVTSIGATIVGWIAEIPGKLRAKLDNFKSAGAALIGGFVDGMKNAGGVIEGIAGNVWNAVRTLLNGAISKINAALEFTINLPGKDLTINPPDIPHLAKGTNYFRGGLALVGEEGPELVNLPRGSKVTPHGDTMGALRGLGGSGGGDSRPIVVQLVVGARVVEQLLIQHTRDTGRPLQVRTLGPA